MLKPGLETKSVLKIKGLIIALSFNHQLVQSEQTGWEDVRVSLTELLRVKSLPWKCCCLSSLELEQRK